MDSVQLAAVLAAVILVASVISVELGVTVALLELTLGVAASNLFHLQTQEWLDFIAKFGSIVLTFLAGMEVDPAYMRRRFLAGSLLLIVVLPRIAPWFFGRYGDRVIEPEIKLVFLCLLVLMVLADESNGHAVLPAFVLGLVMSRHYQEYREEQKRLRVVAFAFLTPFFFIKGGMNVSLGAVVANLGLLAVLLVAKMLPKIAFIYPLARRADRRHATFTTLLMSTGLTFGTISSLYGLNAGIIDKAQFSLLVSVVVLSAVVPTAIAERWFLPDVEREQRIDRRLAYAESEEYV